LNGVEVARHFLFLIGKLLKKIQNFFESCEFSDDLKMILKPENKGDCGLPHTKAVTFI